MLFELLVLGSNSAVPAYNRNMSCQVMQVGHKLYLIDCGEAAQHQMLKNKVKLGKIESIFISHLHGDHYLGLPGLLMTMQLHRRTAPIKIYGPKGLDELITLNLRISESTLEYPVEFHDIDYANPGKIYEDNHITVDTVPLRHSIETVGFVFDEKPKKRKVLAERIPTGLPYEMLTALKEGKDIEFNGEAYTSEHLTLAPKKSRKFAYCSDTCYHEPIIDSIKGADLLYHEATYLEEHKDKADKTLHSTAREAGSIAEQAGVGMLVIGHFSSRYKTLDRLLGEAKEEFPETYLAIEGDRYGVPER